MNNVVRGEMKLFCAKFSAASAVGTINLVPDARSDRQLGMTPGFDF